MAPDEPARSALLSSQARAAILADPAAFLIRRMAAMARAILVEDYKVRRVAGFGPAGSWALMILPAAQIFHAATTACAWRTLARFRCRPDRPSW